MSAILTNLLANKHTSIAGVIYLAAKLGSQLAAVWMPQYKDKLDATTNVIEGAAVAYGLLAAGDSTRSASKQEVAKAIETGDTSILKKADVTVPPAKP